VKVTVRYFASVKEQLGIDAEELELPAGVATVGGVRAHLRARGGAWAETLAESRRITAAVNQDMVKPAAAVKAGDEVAFFPPVTGG
jgi:molybdopterin synthase sulfur carrier subunit